MNVNLDAFLFKSIWLNVNLDVFFIYENIWLNVT